MLVLTRKVQERIQIGEQITITVVRVQGQAVRIGIDAPQEIPIRRAELALQQPSVVPSPQHTDPSEQASLPQEGWISLPCQPR